MFQNLFSPIACDWLKILYCIIALHALSCGGYRRDLSICATHAAVLIWWSTAERTTHSKREATRAVRSVQHGYGLLMVIILQLNLFVFPTHGCCFRLCWGTSRGAIWRRSQRAKMGMYGYHLCHTILRWMWRVHLLPNSNLFGLRSGPSCEQTDSRDGIPRELPSCLKRA